LASFNVDQAEGLRRMLSGPKPRVFTFLSAASGEEKAAMLVNLGASLAQAGREVLLLDACLASEGVSAQLDAVRAPTLLQVARQERALDDVVQAMPQGFGVAALARGPHRAAAKEPQQAKRIAQAFGVLAARSDIVLADAELDSEDNFALAPLAEGGIVVQVANSPESIKSAYALIKRLNGRLGRRPFQLLVTGATEQEAQRVHRNIADAASRYLAVAVHSMGAVPADEHVRRASRLGRTVVDAFPLAGASVAFRRLAGRFVLSDLRAAG
jgi:flagellar biosynthesis protein FlhG